MELLMKYGQELDIIKELDNDCIIYWEGRSKQR